MSLYTFEVRDVRLLAKAHTFLAGVLLQRMVMTCGNNRLVSGSVQPSVAILSVLSISQEYFLALNYTHLSCNCFCN